jgi:hypothetical protein
MHDINVSEHGSHLHPGRTKLPKRTDGGVYDSSTKVYIKALAVLSISFLPISSFLIIIRIPSDSLLSRNSPSDFQTPVKMVSFTTAALSSIAAAGLVQYAPAPFLPVIGVAVTIEMGSAAAWAGAAGGILGGSAAVATAISNSKKKSVGSEFPVKPAKRQDPQYGTQLAWELCRDDVGSATIGMERSGNGMFLMHFF